MRSLLPVLALVAALLCAPSPTCGYGAREFCCGSGYECSCGCETDCACEPGCACGCDVGCGCATECGCEVGCGCEPGCGCGDCCAVDGRQYAGQKWTGCGECCGPPNCRCVEPDGRCRGNCCQEAAGCCGPACGCGDCCEPACECGGCCESACGCGDACGCGPCCHDGGGSLWFKQCGFCQPCWEVLDVLHSISRHCGGGCCDCGGCSSELYWSEWHNDPPQCCDPCDRHGNWIGPGVGYRAPYAHPYAPSAGVYANGNTSGQTKVVGRPGFSQPQQRIARQPKSAPNRNFRR